MVAWAATSAAVRWRNWVAEFEHGAVGEDRLDLLEGSDARRVGTRDQESIHNHDAVAVAVAVAVSDDQVIEGGTWDVAQSAGPGISARSAGDQFGSGPISGRCALVR